MVYGPQVVFWKWLQGSFVWALSSSLGKDRTGPVLTSVKEVLEEGRSGSLVVP